MKVEELEVPNALREFLRRRRGVEFLYPPQEEAIRRGILKGKNIVMCTATASGKTLIAEIAMANAVLTRRVKAIMAVPLRALAYEKARDLSAYEELGIKVAVTTGEYDKEDAWLENYDIIITTYEKLDSLLRHKPNWLERVGVLVIDEIHYLGDSKRGPIIESIIAKAKSLKRDVQVIALSATIGNAKEIAEYLEAELVESNWRPVPLKEGVYYKGVIYYGDGSTKLVRDLGDPLISLVMDSLLEGGQVLVFTNSRSNAVRLASQIARYIANAHVELIDMKALREVTAQLEEASSSKLLAEDLKRVVSYGVAFHHAGLEHEVRGIIEDAFRNRLIKVIVATTTLAAGVNLPARRVIIHDYRRFEPGLGMYPIPVMEYRQMAGRAGRPRLDEYGDAVLIARSEDEVDLLLENYVKSKVESVKSQFFNTRVLKTQILSAIASDYAHDLDGLMEYLSKTLAYRQEGISKNQALALLFKERVRGILKELSDAGLIVERNGIYEATPIGELVNSLYIDVDTALTYIKGLLSMKNATPFSLVYLVIQSQEVPKLRVRKGEFEYYAEFALRHWDEIPIRKVDRGKLEAGDYYDEDVYELLSSVKTTLMLLDWMEEVSEDELYKAYEVGPGDLRSYGELMGWLVHALSKLAYALGRGDVGERLELLKWRLVYGVKAELVELVANLTGVGRVRARLLYDAGFRSIDDIARASPEAIAHRVRGIGEKLARSIVEEARRLIAEGKAIRLKQVNYDKISTRKYTSILDFL